MCTGDYVGGPYTNMQNFIQIGQAVSFLRMRDFARIWIKADSAVFFIFFFWGGILENTHTAQIASPMLQFQLLRSGRRDVRDTPWSQLCENVTSSTKPEVLNIATPPEEDRAAQKIRRSSAVWFSIYASRQTDRHTHRHAHRNTSAVRK